jgi:hypothetical protein
MMEVSGKGGHGMTEVGGLVRGRVEGRSVGEVKGSQNFQGSTVGLKKICCQKKKMYKGKMAKKKKTCKMRKTKRKKKVQKEKNDVDEVGDRFIPSMISHNGIF